MVLYRLRWNENEEIVTGDVSKESPKSISDEIIIKKKFTTPQPEVIYRESEIGKNPYMNRVMIRDSEDFFGRKSEISKIYSRIGAERPQSVSLVGERRIGKSSLLNFIYDPTNRRQYLTDPDKYIFIFVDFQEKRGIDIPDYFAILYGNLIQEFDNQLEINLKPDYDGFTKMINFLEKQGHKLILVFDEFELITKNKNFNHEFYSYARSLASNYNVAYLVASGKNLQSTCYSSDIAEHPFFNIFSSINIGQFNRAEAAELITIPSKRTGYPLEPYIDQIIDIAGFYPFFVQMACAPFFEFVRQDGKISKRNISNVKEEFLDEAKMHFRQIWDSSDEDQRSLLKELALNKNIENNLEYLLPGLIKSGYVRVEDEKPRLFSSVFTDYINSQFINPEHQTRKKSRFFSLFN
jgi:AAA+ ATPase superfamily predicted ATPase